SSSASNNSNLQSYNQSSNIRYQDACYANISLNEYTSKELEFDISSPPALNANSSKVTSNTQHQSRTHTSLINSSILSENSSRKRDIEESEINSYVI
ncbi:12120_t:CDS:2, partial [Funneliformis caledonium]